MRYKRIARVFVVLLLASLTVISAIAGETVRVEEWDLPAPHSHPHDPAVAPDGSIPPRGRLRSTGSGHRIQDLTDLWRTATAISGSPQISRPTSED